MTSKVSNFTHRRLSWPLALLLGALGLVALWQFEKARNERRIEAAEHQRLVNLYEEASGYGPNFKSSFDSEQAVHEIATYNGVEAENMLLALASTEPSIAVANVPARAVAELTRRNDPKVPIFIAGLMQRNTLVGTRRAIAEGLKTQPCTSQCATELLTYLEQIYAGQLNYEDEGLDNDPPDLAAYVRAKNHETQREIYDVLFKDLMRNSAATNEVLVSRYGIGGPAPKPFAVVFVVRAKDVDACPKLEQSAAILKHERPHPNSGILKSLSTAVEVLNCSK